MAGPWMRPHLLACGCSDGRGPRRHGGSGCSELGADVGAALLAGHAPEAAAFSRPEARTKRLGF